MNVLLLGLQNSGKTTLLQALQYNEIRTETVPTLRTRVESISLNKPLIVLQPSKIASPSIHSITSQTRGAPMLESETNNTNVNETTPLILPQDTTTFKQQTQAQLEGHVTRHRMELKVYDLSGQMKYHHLWKQYFVNDTIQKNQINLIIYMIDISDPQTLEDSKLRLIEILSLNNETHQLPVMIICNKVDLISEKEFTTRFIDASGGVGKKLKGLKYQQNRSKNAILLEYLGIEWFEDSYHLANQQLLFDISLFVISLKDINGTVTSDKLSDVVDWIYGST
ncbi:hypothetical protein CANARDRAFT_108190 [[Candida] arabinofermentans NRRL YB-2248]|uniref:G domain-containing protein n=1 Tax=[Candida] arabinofermentans NRRL YB-2248 TaxID=983967 RepID=A0A1E4STV0_9ASCO|nr:hypothetical protein CANARDRAFT_108190 [[Candida] arabinofermentans NRRL YB-2248]